MTTEHRSSVWLNLTTVVATGRPTRTVHSQPSEWFSSTDNRTEASIQFEICCTVDGSTALHDFMLPPPHDSAMDRQSCAEKALQDGVYNSPLVLRTGSPLTWSQESLCDHDHCVWTLEMGAPTEWRECDLAAEPSKVHLHIPATLGYNLSRSQAIPTVGSHREPDAL